ncbi:leucine-rich repeat-containing protein 59-like isoform X2 [Bacillus rossius redtenbacheri]
MAIKKATTLDLSNNRLKSLGKNFATLTHIVKLDLSKNMLTELPENFGDLVLLKHLDLYSNQLTHLPLSMGRLQSLRWLDLKNNPLVPAVAEVAGPCLDAQQCVKCARSVVPFLRAMQEQIDEERERRLAQKRRQQEMAEKAALNQKKEESKKKKKAKAANHTQAHAENGVKLTTRSESETKRTTPNEPRTGKTKTKIPEKKSTSVLWACCKLTLLALFLGAMTLGALWLADPRQFKEVAGVLEVRLWDAVNWVHITAVWLRDHDTTRWAVSNVLELWQVLWKRALAGWLAAQHGVSHFLDTLRNKLLGAV